MDNNKKYQYDKDLALSGSVTLDLLGRQSVRATFRLSVACVEAISVLAAQLGIKQKSVFDHLMEDDQILKSMARELKNNDFDRHGRIQKTFVVSRRSLSFLDTVSSEYNAPRDALVEHSIRRLMPIIAKERKKHAKRKKLFAEISNHFDAGETLITKSEEKLGADDPVVRRLHTAMSIYKSAFDYIAEFIDRGKLIEKFEP